MLNLSIPPEVIDLLRAEFRQVIREELAAVKSASEPEKLLSPAEAARFFSVSTKTIHSWNSQGLLKSQKVSRRIFFKHSDLVEAGKSLKKYKH